MTAKAKTGQTEGFAADIAELRQRARQHIEEGAVTDAYQGNRNTVIKV